MLALRVNAEGHCWPSTLLLGVGWPVLQRGKLGSCHLAGRFQPRLGSCWSIDTWMVSPALWWSGCSSSKRRRFRFCICNLANVTGPPSSSKCAPNVCRQASRSASMCSGHVGGVRTKYDLRPLNTRSTKRRSPTKSDQRCGPAASRRTGPRRLRADCRAFASPRSPMTRIRGWSAAW